METLRHSFELSLPFDEFRVWRQRILPVLEQGGIEQPCLDVLEYVCTEMLNNVLDHSNAVTVAVALDWNIRSVLVHIADDGKGVFAGLRETLVLESDADAAMLVLKGKVTTDPARHTGEGLFFSARVCEWFNLQSARTGLSLEGEDGRWIYETSNESVAGTRLRFRVSRTSPPRLADVFDKFCPQPELRFTRTIVSVALMQQADGALVSRSQGKRLTLGLEKFTTVEFDFTGVDEIRQGFADEVFRVWAAAHPDIEIKVRGAIEPVARVLHHVGFAPAGS
jgi:anti-sigma regulatory factor (Ser/Thr protein kinase)